MADIYFDVDAALTEVPVNVMPLVDDTDFKTIEGAVAYNAAGMALFWHFVNSAGVYNNGVAVTPTTAGNYDWTDHGTSGIYTIEIPASGGASINNDTEGYGWFTGVATGILPWRSPIYGFRAAAINDSLCDTNTTGLLAPTTAGRTLDVSATGEAGIDWANVGSPTTAVNLSGTNIDTDQVVASVTGAVGSVTGAVGSVTGAVGSVTGNVGGNVAGSVASVTAMVTANVTQISGDSVAADNAEAFFDGTGYAGTNNVIPTVTTLTGHTAQTGDAYARLGAPAGASVSADVAAVKAETATIVADTGELQTDWVNGGRLDLILDTAAAGGAAASFGIVHEGTAQSATGTTLVLASGAAFANDELIGATILITGGTGVGQARVITDYVGASDTATVDTWTTTPSGTITYKVFGTPPASASSIPAVNVTQWLGTACATPSVAGVPEVDVTYCAGSAQATIATQASVDTVDGIVDSILLDTAEIGAAGAGLTALATQASVNTIDGIVDNILADTNELQTDWANGGRLDLLLDGAASAGDPWTTSLPGAYGAGTAGYIVGTNLDATVSTRASQTSVDTIDGIVDDILVDTAVIGAAGAGLTALATQASVTAIDDLVDTEVAAIKTVVDAIQVKTDQLTFTAANKIDANILNVNSQGIGASKPYDTAT